jgi:hypothetical protein
VGQWLQLAPVADCAVGYAAHLDIRPNGLYFGTTEPPGAFTWWDGGTWRITAPGRVALSVANDAIIEYGYVLVGDTLEFTDPGACAFRYRRLS